MSSQPNPDALGNLLERIVEKVADGTIPMDPTSESHVSEAADAGMKPARLTTGELYRPISELQREHEQAMAGLCSAVAAGNDAEVKRLFDVILNVEQEQRAAARAIREYALRKLQEDPASETRVSEVSDAGLKPARLMVEAV